MNHGTVDVAPLPSPTLPGSRQAGDELAACLARFLDVSADERTLERARDALALWYGQTHGAAAVSRR
jgi:hypothetical protein